MGNDPAKLARDAIEHPEQTAAVREAFDAFDKDQSGALEPAEFIEFAKVLLQMVEEKHSDMTFVPEEFIGAMFQNADTDVNETVSFEEFVAFLRRTANEERVSDIIRGRSEANAQTSTILFLGAPACGKHQLCAEIHSIYGDDSEYKQQPGIFQDIVEVGDDKMQYKIVNVGAQAGRIKHWIHSFDDAVGMIFVVAMDQFQAGEDGKSHVAQSLAFFKTLIGDRAFPNVPMFVWLNGSDAFAAKLAEEGGHDQLKAVFSEYDGKDQKAAEAFIAAQFQQTASEHGKHADAVIRMNVVNATTTATIPAVLESALEEFQQLRLPPATSPSPTSRPSSSVHGRESVMEHARRSIFG